MFHIPFISIYLHNYQKVKDIDKSTHPVLWLIVMVLFTPVVGLFLNYDVFKFGSMLLLLIWMVVLLIPYVLTQKKWLYIAAASLLFADGFVNLFHWIVLKCPLNASSIFVFLNTNFNEASEFMVIKMTPLLLLFIPYIALFIIVLKRIPQLSFQSKGEIFVWSALWLFVAIYLRTISSTNVFSEAQYLTWNVL